MFLLWLILGLILLTSAETRKLTCSDTAADVCPIGETCSVSCDENCPLFGSKEDVSICGWLQSFGYNTSELLATPYKYNVKIEAINGKSEDSKVKRGLRTTVQTEDHVYPYIKFKFIRQPHSQMKQLGLPVVFHCNASGNSSLKYQWYFSRVTSFDKTPILPTAISGATSMEYSIASTSSTDNGYYICVVSESGISGDVYWSDPAKLEVLYLEKPDVVVPKTQALSSGEVLEKIKCNLPSSYPTAIATWYKYDSNNVAQRISGEEDKFYDPESGVLYLLNTNRESHEGTYECRAENVYLSNTVVVNEVKVTISGELTPNFRNPSKAFFDTDAARTATVGSKVILRCAAYGNPIPSVYWTFGDGIDTLCKIPSSRYNSSDNGRTVELYKVKQQDAEYIYECKAEASGSTVKIDTLRDVGVYKTLKITQDKETYTPRYGTNIVLACPVTGQIRNEWYHNGVRLSSDSDTGEYYTKNRTANSLTIAASVQSHGVYTCLSLSKYGGLVLKNLHTTIPILPVTVHMYLDSSNEVESANSTFLTCTATGYPPPRLYWFENNVLVADSARYSFSFDKANTTIINTTLNISNLQEQTEIKCLAVSQAEQHTSTEAALYTVNPEGEKNIEKVENQNMYIIIGVSCIVVVFLVAATTFLGWRFSKERKTTMPIRTYIKNVQQIQRDSGGEVSTKADMRDEYKYAAHLHDILKTMKIKDEGDIESFRDVIGDWMNEELPGGDESDFARRFRMSFASKRSIGNRFDSSGRYGNQFKLDLKNNERKVSESNMLDETPERNVYIPLGRRSPRRASNPIYAPISLSDGTEDGSTATESLRHTEL